MKPICTKPWTRLYVTADGKCFNCCHQVKPFAQVSKFGNAFEEAWNCDEIKYIRSMLKKGKMPFKYCDCINKRGSIPPDDPEPSAEFSEPTRTIVPLTISVAPKKPLKSVFVIGLPRSCSTELQKTIVELTGFDNLYEPLRHDSKTYFLRKFTQHNTKAESDFSLMKDQLLNHLTSTVVKDVAQSEFVINNFDWLVNHFNVLYIRRPIQEIIMCQRWLGWTSKSHKYAPLLGDMMSKHRGKVINYDDFISRPEVLHEILEGWYDNKVLKLNYITPEFQQKRQSTAEKLKRVYSHLDRKNEDISVQAPWRLVGTDSLLDQQLWKRVFHEKYSNANDPRDKFLDQIVHNNTFAEVGGLWGTINEKVSVAHHLEATSLTMIDSMPKGNELWSKFIARLYRLTGRANCKCISSDFTEVTEIFDVVHCSGVIYHYPDFQKAIDHLKKITGKFLVLSTIVTPTIINNPRGEIMVDEYIHVPSLNEDQREILKVHWKKIVGANEAIGITVNSNFAQDDFAPFWWLPTIDYFKKSVLRAGFRIMDEGPLWEDNAYTLLLGVV